MAMVGLASPMLSKCEVMSMIVKSKQEHIDTRTVGRLSDGSDRKVVSESTWVLQVEQGEQLFLLTFDHDPTEAEIELALADGLGKELVTAEVLSTRLASAKAELLSTQQALAMLFEQIIGGGAA